MECSSFAAKANSSCPIGRVSGIWDSLPRHLAYLPEHVTYFVHFSSCHYYGNILVLADSFSYSSLTGLLYPFP